MVELAGLALLTGLHEWGREPVVATKVVAADAATLRTLVADPASQWRLVAGVSPHLRPRARLAPSRHPRFVHAVVSLAGRDALWLTWILTPRRGTTEVDLAAQIETRSILVRLLWSVGGRRLLRRRLETTLATLAALALRVAEDLDNVEAAVEIPTTLATGTQGAT